MNIRVLGAHNCESQATKFPSLLIDGVLAIDAGGLSSSLSLQEQKELRAILFTHQHYDHIRDLPAVAMNLFLDGSTVNIYCSQTVCDLLTSHLLNDRLYPKFHEVPEAEPTVKLTVIEPYRVEQIEGYGVLAVPVNHSPDAVGYQVTSPDGQVVFYTGDTGPGLAHCWERVSPQLLVIEVTVPDSYQEFAIGTKHLTPSLLHQELTSFHQLKGYLPRVITVHMNPRLEPQIEAEIAAVAERLKASISLAYEGMELNLQP